jgi:hypothetical protein
MMIRSLQIVIVFLLSIIAASLMYLIVSSKKEPSPSPEETQALQIPSPPVHYRFRAENEWTDFQEIARGVYMRCQCPTPGPRSGFQVQFLNGNNFDIQVLEVFLTSEIQAGFVGPREIPAHGATVAYGTAMRCLDGNRIMDLFANGRYLHVVPRRGPFRCLEGQELIECDSVKYCAPEGFECCGSSLCSKG